MPRGISKDASHLRDVLEKGVILIDGGSEGDIDVGVKDDPVWVGIIVDVNGYGPHTGAIYAYQNRFHGNPDTPLQAADEMLEDWKRQHEADYLKELEEEYGERADEVFVESFDGWSFKLAPREFEEAVRGTDAAKYFDFTDSHKEWMSELRAEFDHLLDSYQSYQAKHPHEDWPDLRVREEVRERSARIEALFREDDAVAAEREINALSEVI